MKISILTALALLFMAITAKAQWVSPDGNAYLYNPGKQTFAIIGNSAGTNTTYGFLGTSADTSGYFDFHVFKNAHPTVTGNLVLNVTGGQVGIGTSVLSSVRLNNSIFHTFNAGEARLVVVNTSDSTYSDAMVIKGGNALPPTHAQGILFVDANSMQAAIRAKRLNLVANYQSDLQFYTGDGISQFQDEANVRMTITHAGQVGIGIKTPADPLDVVGSIAALNNTTTTFNAVSLSAGNTNVAGATNVNRLRYGGNDVNNNYFTIQGPGNVDCLTVNNTNIGIGTTSPDQKLTVNGVIHSKEVKVDTSIPLPDYVFEPTYKLQALTELKTYLDAHHHLPEIAPAAELEKKGINLSEMNVKLLKKVEELTLYLIDKDQQVQQLQNQLKQQQAKSKQQDERLTALEQGLIKLKGDK